jgi:hypothetical protein
MRKNQDEMERIIQVQEQAKKKSIQTKI